MNALAVVTFLDLCSKICDDNDDVELGIDLEEGFNVPCGGVAFSCLPLFLYVLGSLRRDPRINHFPIIHNITNCVHLKRRENLVQECPCGGGEEILKIYSEIVLATNTFPF